MSHAVEVGEFQTATARVTSPTDLDMLKRLQRAWRDEGTEIAAAEFAGAAIIVGDPEFAVDALAVLQQSSNGPRRALSTDPDDLSPSMPPDLSKIARLESFWWPGVADARLRTVRDPRNPIAWADLARHYMILGELDRAHRALGVARALAPRSRYLLRAQVRLLVHSGNPRGALKALEASPRTREDPWLMAASLSVSAGAGLRIVGFKAANRIITAGNFSRRELSELHSELATIELNDSDRRARASFRRSLLAPTGNSLAQAEWARTRLSDLEVPLDDPAVPFKDEAASLAASERGEWRSALGHASQWLFDQPFDPRAAIQLSYIAAAGLDDYQQSLRAALFGLKSSPDNVTLRNNAAYALLELGDIRTAQAHLDVIATPATHERVAVNATRGLLAYRKGDLAQGEALYRQAIKIAQRTGDTGAEAIALGMLMRERIDAGEIDTRLRQDISALVGLLEKTNDEPAAQRLLKRIVPAAQAALGRVHPT